MQRFVVEEGGGGLGGVWGQAGVGCDEEEDGEDA